MIFEEVRHNSLQKTRVYYVPDRLKFKNDEKRPIFRTLDQMYEGMISKLRKEEQVGVHNWHDLETITQCRYLGLRNNSQALGLCLIPQVKPLIPLNRGNY